ncbi:MAG: UDP-N-acetylmuramate dehydrogenase [Candidatus Moranbacteria bacterium]|nr:UDP-N-acetylmuramate dehydrogenase [Candidatus Moranbacteria bacterium]
MEFKENEMMAGHTTFRIGGPAKLYAEVMTTAELVAALDRAESEKLPVYLLGGGSNVLFSDKGFPGMVIKNSICGLQVRDDGTVSVGAGVRLFDVVTACCSKGLSGIERLSGIPGTVGGAVRGNVGAFGTEMGSSVTSVKVFHRKTGEIKEFGQEDCQFGYRMSRFKREPDLIVLSIELLLAPGHEPSTLLSVSKEVWADRESKHPQDVFCAGSFFVNPIVHDQKLREEFSRDAGKVPKDDKLPAGWLIDQVGLRGKMIGHAKVSELHPNYILNTGGATAEEILTIVSIVKQRVRDELNIQLCEEVQFVGFGSEKSL